MNSRKGSEHTVWIIIVLVIALVVAVVLINVFSKTMSDNDKYTSPVVSTGGCKLLCETCKLTSDWQSCISEKNGGACASQCS